MFLTFVNRLQATPLIGILFGTVIIRAATSGHSDNTVVSSTNRSYPMSLPLGSMHTSTAVHVDVEWARDGPEYDGNKALGLAS